MSEGQQPSALIHPGNGSQSAQRQISLHQGYAHGAARFQFLIRRNTGSAACIGQCYIKGLQPLLQHDKAFRGKASGLQRRTFGQQGGIRLFPVGFRTVQHIQHVLDRRQKAVMGIRKSLAIGNGAGQHSINVDRTAAHSLSDTAAAGNHIAAGPDQDLIAADLAAGHTQHLNRKGLYCVAVDDGLRITAHACPDILHRHQRRPCQHLRSHRA